MMCEGGKQVGRPTRMHAYTCIHTSTCSEVCLTYSVLRMCDFNANHASQHGCLGYLLGRRCAIRSIMEGEKKAREKIHAG